jgi:uncharacterized protein (TIGR00730 family)
MLIIQRIIFCYKATIALLSTIAQLVYGMWRIGKLNPPFVSIFGGSRLQQTDYYALEAHKLAQRLVDANVSVLTGGGPGIMEAVNCGAIYSKRGTGRSIGIGVRDLGEPRNICTQEYLQLNQFWARKWLLTRYSSAFIVFPGGFGTLDELSEVLTLLQIKQLGPTPIVLVGTEYWKLFSQWCTDELLHHGLIGHKEIELFIVTDDLNLAFSTVVKSCIS